MTPFYDERGKNNVVLSTFILEYDQSNVALRIPVTNSEHIFLFFFFFHRMMNMMVLPGQDPG